MRNLTFTAVLVPALLFAGTIVHDIRFDPAELRITRITGFDLIELASGYSVTEPGKPSLPLVNITLAVPADARVTGVTVETVTSEKIPGVYKVMPAQPAVPIGYPLPPMAPGFPEIYSSDNPWPDKLLQHYGTGCAAGFRLVSVVLSPLQYQPQSGQLWLNTQLRIVVDFEHTGTHAVLTPTQQKFGLMGLVPLVANPEDLTRFAPAAIESDLPEVTLLVVTADHLAGLLRPFVEYKSSRGFRAEIRTVEWANRNYTGRDIQERVRNMIRDFYEHRGTCFVLLAGDNAEVPCRRIRLNMDEEADIPTDLYYADLDYSWDSNHNNLFGEMEDSVDLYADVLLGRVSVQNSSEIQTFLDKVTKYETDPATDYIRRSLLPSGWLWRSIGYHGRFMNDSIANITPLPWVDRSIINPPGATVVRDSFEHGFAIFNPAGHGNAAGVYDENGTPIYTTGVAGTQRNDRRFTITTSLACNPGDFESEDCLAEVTHNCPNGGSIGVMMNSRYGWGTPPSIGPSELLCIRFYDFMLRRNTTNLAACHDRSREVYALSARYSTLWRWCMTEFNLFGDPTIDLWTDVPARLTVQAPESITTGSQTIQITVRSGSTPVHNSRVCAWMKPDLCVVGFTGANGQAELNIHPCTTGTLKVTASAHSYLPAAADIKVTPGAAEPRIVLARFAVNDEGSSEPNGILEPGETGRITLILRNSGTAPATGTAIVLRPNSPGIRLPDSAAALGTIIPRDSATTSDITVTALPEALPGSNPEIVGIVSSGEGSWEILFALSIGYPGRTSADIDTGTCALTLTGRGVLGFDTEGTRSGRGFRFPKTDTSCLNSASFCLATSAGYVVDRFYNQSRGFDRDWRLVDSVRQVLPRWGEDQLLRSGFSDAGHPHVRNVVVQHFGLGFADSCLAGCVILIFDIINNNSDVLAGAHAGIIADFDIRATDRFHDVARTTAELHTAYMRSLTVPNRVAGIKLIAPTAPAHLACIDHARYVYPDTGLSEQMKYRFLAGELGSTSSDRPFNWSVSVATGPFNISPNGGRQRVALALVAAEDSVSYHDACRACQDWYDAHVGIMDTAAMYARRSPYATRVMPNPFRHALCITWQEPANGTPVSIRAYSSAGQFLTTIHEGIPEPEMNFVWRPSNLATGVYFIKVEGRHGIETHRVVLSR
ncbi:MAG: C25 family cysteine peptidase [candidate division WOR-3 bacterium]